MEEDTVIRSRLDEPSLETRPLADSDERSLRLIDAILAGVKTRHIADVIDGRCSAVVDEACGVARKMGVPDSMIARWRDSRSR